MMRFNVGGQFLELPANFNFQLKKKNILYSFDNIELERSTSFLIPATEKNTSIFGWSNNFHRYGEQARKKIPAQLQMDGVTKDGYIYITKYTPQAFECVFVTGELLGLAEIKELGDWSQFIDDGEGLYLSDPIIGGNNSRDVAASRVSYRTNGDVQPSWLLPYYAEQACRNAGVAVVWGDILDRLAGERIIIGERKGVTASNITLTRTYLDEQSTTPPYPLLNNVVLGDEGSLAGVIEIVQSEYPIFSVNKDDATQYYGYVQEFISRQDLILTFADDTPTTLFLGSAQQNGQFQFLGDYSFDAEGVISGESLAGREVEITSGQTFILLTQNDYWQATDETQPREGWSIANETLTVSVSVRGSDNQPLGRTYIRVKDNVPEMTITELLKVCAALSGTILSYKNSEVVFIEDIAGGSFRALDKPLNWSNLTRGVADYAQRNTIVFDSAAGVTNRLQAEYEIENVNIAESKELLVLPFSEGDEVIGYADIRYLYVDSEHKGYTLGIGNDGVYDMQRVILPTNASMQDVLNQSTSIIAEVKMTEKQFDTLQYDMILFFQNTPWIWTDGVWSTGVARMSLSKVGVDAIAPPPPRLPLDYQEVEFTSIYDRTSGIKTDIPYRVNTKIFVLADDLRYSRETIILSSTGGVFGIEYYGLFGYWWIATCCCWSGRIQIHDYNPVELTKIEVTLLSDSTIYNVDDGAVLYSGGAPNITGQYLHINEFCDTNRKSMGSFKLFTLIISDTNTGELLHELIPCYNKNTLISGVYDLINAKFYAIDGVAINGPDVNQQRPWE